MTLDEKIPPQAPEIEPAVLSAILLDKDAIGKIQGPLSADFFADPRHWRIASAIIRLSERFEPVDLLSVVEELRKAGELEAAGGILYISQLTNRMASSANIDHHVRLLTEKYLLRKTIEVSVSAERVAYDHSTDPFELIDGMIKDLDTLVEQNTKADAMSFAHYEQRQLERMDDPDTEMVPTGFPSLDREIGGWRIGDLHIVAGRPGMGKTSFCVSSADGCASQKSPSLLFSMEVAERAMQARIAARRCGIPLGSMVRGEMTPEQIAIRHQGIAAAKDLPLYIRYDTGMTISEIKAEVKRQKRLRDIRVVYIDQLNWIKPARGGSRDNEVGSITRGLKQMAMQVGVAVVLLHQLSRAVESRGGDKRPQLSDLRDSGNVEQDAQVVIFVYRPEYYNIMEDEHGSTINLIEAIIAKNSNGSIGSVRLMFDAPCAAVRDLDSSAPRQHTYRDPYADRDDGPDLPF